MPVVTVLVAFAGLVVAGLLAAGLTAIGLPALLAFAIAAFVLGLALTLLGYINIDALEYSILYPGFFLLCGIAPITLMIHLTEDRGWDVSMGRFWLLVLLFAAAGALVSGIVYGLARLAVRGLPRALNRRRFKTRRQREREQLAARHGWRYQRFHLEAIDHLLEAQRYAGVQDPETGKFETSSIYAYLPATKTSWPHAVVTGEANGVPFVGFDYDSPQFTTAPDSSGAVPDIRTACLVRLPQPLPPFHPAWPRFPICEPPDLGDDGTFENVVAAYLGTTDEAERLDAMTSAFFGSRGGGAKTGEQAEEPATNPGPAAPPPDPAREALARAIMTPDVAALGRPSQWWIAGPWLVFTDYAMHDGLEIMIDAATRLATRLDWQSLAPFVTPDGKGPASAEPPAGA